MSIVVVIIRFFLKSMHGKTKMGRVHKNEHFCGWDDGTMGISPPSNLFFFNYLSFTNENMKGKAICYHKWPACLTPCYLPGVAGERNPGTPDTPIQAACGEAPEQRHYRFPAIGTSKLEPSANDMAMQLQNTFQNRRKLADNLPQKPSNCTSLHSHS